MRRERFGALYTQQARPNSVVYASVLLWSIAVMTIFSVVMLFAWVVNEGWETAAILGPVIVLVLVGPWIVGFPALIAWRAWRGRRWPRFAVFVLLAPMVSLLWSLDVMATIEVLMIIAAAILLWLPSSRGFAASVHADRRADL